MIPSVIGAQSRRCIEEFLRTTFPITNPHFAGGARMAVIVESLDRNEEFPLEGEFFAWAAAPLVAIAILVFDGSST